MEIFVDAMPALGSAWIQILQPLVLGYLVIGVVMGLAIGVFPGLGLSLIHISEPTRRS